MIHDPIELFTRSLIRLRNTVFGNFIVVANHVDFTFLYSIATALDVVSSPIVTRLVSRSEIQLIHRADTASSQRFPTIQKHLFFQRDDSVLSFLRETYYSALFFFI